MFYMLLTFIQFFSDIPPLVYDNAYAEFQRLK